MTAAALALATLLWGQVNVTVEPPPVHAATGEPTPACRRRCAAVERALARADASRPESVEPLVAAWEALVADRTCALPGFDPCWPDRAHRRYEYPPSDAVRQLVWLATPTEGRSPPDHRALRVRAQRALIHPCTVAAFDEEMTHEFGGTVFALGAYVANGALRPESCPRPHAK